MSAKVKLVINAIHSKTGGGLVYLNNILPFLAKNEAVDITVVCAKGYADRINIPDNVNKLEVEAPTNFIMLHLYEQLVLGFKLRFKIKNDVTLNIANYAPLLAPNNIILLINNPEVAKFAKTNKAKAYWLVLSAITKISMFFAKKILTNGKYIGELYTKGVLEFAKSKLVLANSGVNAVELDNINKEDYIITVGDFYVQKNYPFLLKSFKEVLKQQPNLKLKMVGRFVDAEVETKIKNILAADLHLTDSVEI